MTLFFSIAIISQISWFPLHAVTVWSRQAAYRKVCFVLPFMHDICFVPCFCRFSGYQRDFNYV